MQLQCSCNAAAMQHPCSCHTAVMQHPPCSIHSAAMQLPCSCHAASMQHPCSCHAAAMQHPCSCQATAITRKPIHIGISRPPIPVPGWNSSTCTPTPDQKYEAILRNTKKYEKKTNSYRDFQDPDTSAGLKFEHLYPDARSEKLRNTKKY